MRDSLPFQRWSRLPGIDPYAHVRRMNSETPSDARPEPGTSGPRAVATTVSCARGPSQYGAPGCGALFAIALTAASTIILTRFLGVDGYGRFTVLTVFLLIGVSLSEFGLNGTASPLVRKRREARGDLRLADRASPCGVHACAAITALVIFALYPDNDAPCGRRRLTAAWR